MLILFHKETRKKFLSLAASLVHADDAIRTEKKKEKSCNNFSGFKLFTDVVELFLLDALLFPLIVPDNCISFSLQLMDECLLLVFEFLVSLCWKFIIIYQASVFVFLCVIIIALLLSSKPKTYKLHTGVPLSIPTSIK